MLSSTFAYAHVELDIKSLYIVSNWREAAPPAMETCAMESLLRERAGTNTAHCTEKGTTWRRLAVRQFPSSFSHAETI